MNEKTESKNAIESASASQPGVTEPTKEPTTGSKPADQSAPQSIQIDDARAQVCYANFCRVTGTPEELILDFGLNSQPVGTPTEAIDVKQRLILNYFTAKRLLQALGMSVQRHEQAFGVLETDVQKRVMMLPRKAAQQAAANG